MLKFKGLLIDLDNCLYEYDKCNNLALAAVLDFLSSKTGKPVAELKEIFCRAREDVKRYTGNTASSHSRILYFQRLVEMIFNKTNFKLINHLHDMYWDFYIGSIELFDGVIEFLGYVKSKGVKISVVTDLTADIQMRKLVESGLADYVDLLVSSEEAGFDKPHKTIFEIAVSKLGLNKDEVVMFGDNEGKDIVGAKNFGIHAELIGKEDFKNGRLKEYF